MDCLAVSWLYSDSQGLLTPVDEVLVLVERLARYYEASESSVEVLLWLETSVVSLG
jgi:hypothetical protein